MSARGYEIIAFKFPLQVAGAAAPIEAGIRVTPEQLQEATELVLLIDTVHYQACVRYLLAPPSRQEQAYDIFSHNQDVLAGLALAVASASGGAELLRSLRDVREALRSFNGDAGRTL